MKNNSPMEIAIAMIYQPDVYHLQLRNGAKQKGAIGLMGCFGGQREPNESFKHAAVREVKEETNLFSSLSGEELDAFAESLRQVDEIEVKSDHNGQIIDVRAVVVEMLLPVGTKVETTRPDEGEAVEMTQEEIIAADHKLTPATQAFFRRYLEYGPEHN